MSLTPSSSKSTGDPSAGGSEADCCGSPLVARTAWRSAGAHLRLWLVAALGLALDLGSKEWAFHTLRQGGSRVLIPGVLELHTTLNPGALFGIGSGHTEIFLIASVLALILVVWMFAQSTPKRWLTQVALGAILAGALGNMYDRVFVQLVKYPQPRGNGAVERYYVQQLGADGQWVELREYPPTAELKPRTLPRNAPDQLRHPIGYVRDFIKIPTRWFGGRELWPWVFNVADSLLVSGVIILSLRMLHERQAVKSPQALLDAGVEKT